MKKTQNNDLLSLVLKPISADLPCGKWNRYGEDFMSLSNMRQEDDPDLPMGEWERPLIKADWIKITNKCIDYLHINSKDLQVVVWLCDALVRTKKIQGFCLGLEVIDSLLNKYWTDLWPKLEEDTDARTAPFIWLNTRLVSRLNQSIILLDTSIKRVDPVSLTDWEISLKDNSISRDKIRSSITDEDLIWLSKLKKLSNEAISLIDSISTKLDKFLKKESPSLMNLRKTANTIENFTIVCMTEIKQKKELNKPNLESFKNNKREINKENTDKSINAERDNDFDYINDREKLYSELGRIANFLQEIEPHSPTPYVIKKIINWKDMSFSELTNEISKDTFLKGILQKTDSVEKNN